MVNFYNGMVEWFCFGQRTIDLTNFWWLDLIGFYDLQVTMGISSLDISEGIIILDEIEKIDNLRFGH